MEDGFVLDTSAFISLECVFLLEEILKSFSIITTPPVMGELNEFAKHDDDYGRIAKRVLKLKKKFIVKPADIKERIDFLEETDNEVYNLSLAEKLPLITDDCRMSYHAKEKATVYFSTFFLTVFLTIGKITKSDAIDKLKKLRDKRNWQNNIIYLTTKKALDSF